MRALFPPYQPDPRYRPSSTPVRGTHARIRWLGTAGHSIEYNGSTLLLDPYFTRSSLLRTAFLPMRPTPERWWHHVPSSVDAILVGHSHFDHLLDAPEIALRTGALLIGSESTMHVARAHGVPEEQLRPVSPSGTSLDVGPWKITFVPSLHGRIFLHRVPLPGVIPDELELPLRFTGYRMGGAFGIHLETKGLSIYHNGSADLVDAKLNGLSADVLLVGIAGRKDTPDYLPRLARLLSPSLVIPTHFDSFFSSLDEPARLIPGIDLPGFLRDAANAAPSANVLLPTWHEYTAVPVGSPAKEAVLFPL